MKSAFREAIQEDDRAAELKEDKQATLNNLHILRLLPVRPLVRGMQVGALHPLSFMFC